MAATIRDTVRNLFATARENAVSREEFHETQQAVVNLIGQMGDTRRRLSAAEATLAKIEIERDLSETDLSAAATLRAHEDRITKAEQELTRAFTCINQVSSDAADQLVVIDARLDAAGKGIQRLESWLDERSEQIGMSIAALQRRIDAIDGKLVSHYGARLAACEGDITRIGDTLSDHLHATEPTDKPAEAAEDEYAAAHKAIVAALSAFHCELDWLMVSPKYNEAFDRLRQAIFSAMEPLDPMRVPF